MNINFELYKIFYYVCSFMSITDTAKHLYVSQPAITKQIHNLEKALGVILFVRSKKKLELTEEGKKLFKEIKTPVEKLLSIEGQRKNIPEKINIIAGYSTSKNFLLKTLSKYNETYPDVKIEVNFYPYHEAIDRLRNGQADLIFVNMKNHPNRDFDGLKLKKCFDVHDIFVIHKDYKGKVPEILKIDDLNSYPIICKSGKSVARNTIEEYYANNYKEKKTFNPKYELSNNWLIEEYVKNDKGIGIITKEYIIDELNYGELIEIPCDYSLPNRDIGYAMRKDYAYNQFIEEFINELKKDFPN